MDQISSSSNVSNVRHTTGRKIRTPDEEKTIGTPVPLLSSSNTVISPRVKGMTPGEKREKELLAISPRSSPENSSMSTQKNRSHHQGKDCEDQDPMVE